MNWIFLVAIAVIADVLRVYSDNYITDVYFKERHGIAQRLFYGTAYIIIGVLLILCCAPDLLSLPITTILFFFLSGVLSSLSGIPYYHALECDDSTNLGIFFQFAPILYLLGNYLFLGGSISPLQLVAIPVILAAPTVIVLTTGKRSRNTRLKSMALIFLSMFITVVGNLIFVNVNSANVNLFAELCPVFLGLGIADVVSILICSKWRKRFHAVVKNSQRKVYIPMFFDTIASVAKTVSYRAALIFAPTVALASASTDAVSPIAIFFAGLVLTLIWPKFGREKLNKKTVLVHLIATVLVVIGIVLMQF